MCNSDEPEDVKYWLGELILVGDEIEYRQRIYLGTNQSQTPAPKVAIAPFRRGQH
jgi:hypothetical protein